MKTYSKGDSVNFTLSGTGNVSLDAVDFSVYVFSDPNNPVCVTDKSAAVKVSDNLYRIDIAPSETVKWHVGTYDLEVYVKDTTKRILWIDHFLRLRDSAAKKEVRDE